MNRVPTYLFILSILLIAAAYYIGLSTDASTVFSGTKNILYAATGRNAGGQFQNYPQGATPPNTTG